MKNSLLLILLIASFSAVAQPKKAVKKYPSLLWEITGKNLKRPSYLFGTMHVSDKMVFNLDDSFYHALKSADVIALELDPATWQAHYAKLDREGELLEMDEAFSGMFGDAKTAGQLKMYHFSIDPYIDRVAEAYNKEPVNINAYLYRNNAYKMDFQENTYLDLHLFQCGVKLGKRIAALENLDTSDAIVKRAEKAAREDRSYSYSDQEYVSGRTRKIEDAYRKGDLDILDSLDNMGTALKFREIFLYERNQIQANSIDTILQHNENVFAAVGAAHLPGDQGVIEMLRKKGYKLRPVKIRSQNSPEKDRIEKLVAPITFTTAYTSDSLVSVQLPGPWFNMGNSRLLQHADMSNGSYYTLYRLRTSAAFWNETPAQVLKRADSLLYEKIPGKIQTKKKLEIGGYPALSIVSLTRRGDLQRYCIVATPFELMVFKMSGNGDYLTRSDDADRFFSSITIRKQENERLVTDWSPSWGGFSVRFPHKPAITNKVQENAKQVPFEFTAINSENGISYNLVREVLQRSDYMEEDSFELNLMDESYASSKMVEKQQSRRVMQVQGYPALLTSYKLKNGQYSQVLSLIQGANYYSLVAQKAQPFHEMDAVLSSFRVKPFVYPAITSYSNAVAGYSMQSPVNVPTAFMDKKKEQLTDAMSAIGGDNLQFLEDFFKMFNMVTLKNDTIGETIGLASFAFPKYGYVKDSATWMKDLQHSNTHLVRSKKETVLKGWQITETFYSDSNSSRMMHTKTFYRNGIVFELNQYSDTLSTPSAFSNAVFSSFEPADSLKGIELFQRKGPLFIKEFSSKDTTERKSALANVRDVQFTVAELPALKNIIDTLSWANKNYLSLKTNLLNAFGSMEDGEATELLKQQYEKVKDTSVFQQAILNALLAQQTLASFKTFEELVVGNPPVSIDDVSFDYATIMRSALVSVLSQNKKQQKNYDLLGKQTTWSALGDSLALTKQIMPGLMSLLALDDYKKTIENLMEKMADSNYLDASVMQPYYGKYLLEAKQGLKKMQAAESAADIKRKASDIAEKGAEEDDDDDSDYNRNDDNGLLTKIQFLLPFYKTNAAVKDIVTQGFQLKNNHFKYQLLRLMLRTDKTAIPDTLYSYYAKDLEYRRYLYYVLQKDSLLGRMPAIYTSAESIAESMAKNLINATKDTMLLAAVKTMTLKGRTGSVYVYKYRKGAKTNPWHWALVGMLPSDSLVTDRDDLIVSNSDAGLVVTGKNEKQEIERLIKEAIYGLRPCASSFYEDAGQSGEDEDEVALVDVDADE